MIDNYNEFKHKCIVIPFEEFKDLMDGLYNLEEDLLEPKGTTYEFIWEFYNSLNNCQFHFKRVHPKLVQDWNIPNITYDDIAELFNIDNISEIICYDPDKYPVYIIYD